MVSMCIDSPRFSPRRLVPKKVAEVRSPSQLDRIRMEADKYAVRRLKKSDRFRVPEKPANKGKVYARSAEQVEERDRDDLRASLRSGRAVC